MQRGTCRNRATEEELNRENDRFQVGSFGAMRRNVGENVLARLKFAGAPADAISCIHFIRAKSVRPPFPAFISSERSQFGRHFLHSFHQSEVSSAAISCIHFIRAKSVRPLQARQGQPTSGIASEYNLQLFYSTCFSDKYVAWHSPVLLLRCTGELSREVGDRVKSSCMLHHEFSTNLNYLQ